jgi:hypothetical protein
MMVGKKLAGVGIARWMCTAFRIPAVAITVPYTWLLATCRWGNSTENRIAGDGIDKSDNGFQEAVGFQPVIQ